METKEADRNAATKRPRPPSEAEPVPARERPPVPEEKLRLVGPRAFKLLWDGHSAAGIVIGLGLFVIFYAGAFALFHADLIAWADPALRADAAGRPTADAIVGTLLEERPPVAGSDVSVVFPFDARTYYSVYYPTAAGDTVNAWMNAATGQMQPRGGRSVLADLPYDLHYFAQAGLGGHLLSGFIAVFFLFAVGTGLLVHLRKLPKDWHTFRPRAALRTALADAHNVLGLVGLPYAVMYAITGAFFGLLIAILAPTAAVVFDGDGGAISEARAGFRTPEHEATGESAAMLSPGAVVDALPPSWDETVPLNLEYHGWGDAGAHVEVEMRLKETLTATGGTAVLNAATGAMVEGRHPGEAPALGRAINLFVSLHFANFGGRVMDVLYFLLALATGAVIVSGNVLWITVRRPKDPRATPWLHRALARLTVGATAGLVAALPLLFLAAQALPLEMAGRQGWENTAFFSAWGVLVVAAFFGKSAERAAQWQLVLAAGLSLAVPLANALGTGAWPWVSAAHGWWGIFLIDVGFLASAPLLLWTARRIGHSSSSPE